MSNPLRTVRISPERAEKLAKRRDEMIARLYVRGRATPEQRATVLALAKPILARISRGAS